VRRGGEVEAERELGGFGRDGGWIGEVTKKEAVRAPSGRCEG
jgi:hypothetical protein